MLREDIRGTCHSPCIYNENDRCDMSYLFLMKQKSVQIK